jgi:hypothetical protein
MTSFSEQVNNDPAIVSLLKVRQLQTDQFSTPQAAAQQDGKNGVVSFCPSFRPCWARREACVLERR